jgi:hypothetical protein
MKTFLKWTAVSFAVGLGTVFAARAIQAAREKMKRALGEAEAVADKTRAALEQTERALHTARESM